jgi:flagellar hook protein FlgE
VINVNTSSPIGGSALQQGLQGMKGSKQEMVASAGKIAAAGTLQAASKGEGLQNIAEPLVDMKIQQHVFDASAKVVSVASQALGTLLDVQA